MSFNKVPLSFLGFPGGSAGKESICNVGDLSSIPGLGRSPGEGNGYPLQCSGLESSRLYSPWGRKESDTTESLSLSLSFLPFSPSPFPLLIYSRICKPLLPCSSVGKESPCNAGDPGSIPGLGRSAAEGICYPLQYSWASLLAHPAAMRETWVWSLGWEDPPGEGKGYPLHYSGLENSMDCTVHEVTKSQTQLSNFHFHASTSIKNQAVKQMYLTLTLLALTV